MKKIYIAKQKIVNGNGKTFGCELLFRDSPDGIKHFPSNSSATSQVLMNVLTHMNLDDIMVTSQKAFINVDEKILMSNTLNLLDPNNFIIEILESVIMSESLEKRVAALHKRGFTIGIDDFDCKAETIQNFKNILKYTSIVKVDAQISIPEERIVVVKKFSSMGITMLAEKIETKEEYQKLTKEGFTLFQGYYISRPEVISYDAVAETTAAIIMKLISIIKTDNETNEIEKFIKQRPELSYNIIKFINNQLSDNGKINSITHAITLMGRQNLMRWLIIYLYAETTENDFSEDLLKVSIERAEYMELNARNGEEAFMVGMFSMLDALFSADINDVLKGVKLNSDASNALINKKGELGKLLTKREGIERDKYLKIITSNFHKIDIADLIFVMSNNNIKF